ncbi:MAG: hypothetical protein R3B99_04080 [Polyangiales bacterium]
MRFLSCLVLLCVAGDDDRPPPRDGGFDATGFDAEVADADVTDAEVVDAPRPPIDAPLDPDAACAAASSMATVERLPVDIIWMIDNSSSMEPAIEEVQRGLNAFATLVAGRDLDYRVIMLSLRGVGSTSLGGSTRYQVCIPPPLAGDSSCGDGTRFFHRSVDVRSTSSSSSSSAPSDRPRATPRGSREAARRGVTSCVPTRRRRSSSCRTTTRVSRPIRSSVTPAAATPSTATPCRPGVLDASWGGLFEDYVFSGIYGWGSTADPSTRCTFSDGSMPSSAGPNYSTLVLRTGGVRAQICDGPAAWSPFFDAVATAVDRTSRVDCALEIPPPPDGGFFDPMRINVFVREGETSTRIGRVSGPGACDPTRGGWHYDDEGAPTRVVLCPVSCEQVQPSAGVDRGVEVQFGCQSVPI